MKYLYLLVLVTIFNAWTVQAQEKVSVQVFYESLCPDSIKFITKQLYPALQHDNLARRVELELIPYGKSKQEYLNGWQFTCHHGPNECYGNMVQACALSFAPRTQNGFNKETVGYINCLMSKVEPKSTPFMYPTRECASANNIQNVDQIERCANSTEGQKIFSDFGIITLNLKPELKSVPTIIFEKHFDQPEQDLAVDNFQKALCNKLKNKDTIPECQGSSASFEQPAHLMIVLCTLLVSSFKLYF